MTVKLNYIPQILLLHCIKHFPGPGGESVFADSLYVLNKLKSQHPDKYQILTDTVVDFWDVGTDAGKEFFALNQKPMIQLVLKYNLIGKGELILLSCVR